LKYAAIGMHVVIVDINEESLDEAVKAIKGVSGVGEVWGLKVDVSKIDEVVAMREKVFEEFGEVRPRSSRPDKELISGPRTHGQCRYWQDHPSHVDYYPPCGITEQLGDCTSNQLVWSNEYRTGFRTIYGSTGEP
jgi:hypothetical protein